MCCFKSKISKWCVTTFSVLTALSGLFLIGICFKLILDTDSIFGGANTSSSVGASEAGQNPTAIVQTGPSPATESGSGLDEISKRISVIAFVVGTLAVIWGLIGICTAKVQNCIITFMFGTTSCLLTVAFTMAASVVLTLYFVTPEQVTQFCEEDMSTVDLDGITKTVVDGVNLYIDDIDKGLADSVDEYMCTDYCPCVWIDFAMWTASQEEDFKTNSRYNFEGPYENFIDCYMDKKQAFGADGDSKPVNEAVISVVKTLEETYNCSGLCQKPLFWTHKSSELGPPREACIYSLKNDFDSNAVWIGWTMVAISAFIGLALLTHCGLYLTDDEKLKRKVRKRTFIMD